MTDYKKLLGEAFHKPVAPERGIGCGRIYVAVSGDKAEIAAISKAVKALGEIWQKRNYYGDSNAIYIGYDNCDGRALARGTAVLEALKSAGVSAYRSECGD